MLGVVGGDSNETLLCGRYTLLLVTSDEYTSLDEAKRALGMGLGWINLLAACNGGLVRASDTPTPARLSETGVTTASLQPLVDTWVSTSWADRIGLKMEILSAITIGVPRQIWAS
jgi:hypothetical protein